MLTHLSMSALRGARSQSTPSTAAPDPKPVIYPTLFLAGPIPRTVAIGSGFLRGRMCAPAGCATGPSVVSPAVLAEVPVGFNCVGSPARGTLVTARRGIGCRGRPGQFSRGGRRGHRARGRPQLRASFPSSHCWCIRTPPAFSPEARRRGCVDAARVARPSRTPFDAPRLHPRPIPGCHRHRP